MLWEESLNGDGQHLHQYKKANNHSSSLIPVHKIDDFCGIIFISYVQSQQIGKSNIFSLWQENKMITMHPASAMVSCVWGSVPKFV